MENGEGGREAKPSGSSWAGVGVGEKPQEEEENMVEEKVSDDDDVDEEDGDDGGVAGFVPGPLVTLKQQFEKDKDDESLRRWKEKLLGSIEGDLNEQLDPEVTFHSIGIVSDDCGETTTPLLADKNQTSGLLFTLKEGSKYRIKLTFAVQHNLVSGLRYSNTVRKGGIKDKNKGMLGTFAPQQEPYTHILDEETTPSGMFARGIYSAKLKFEDDDKRCHLKLKYSFEIKKRG